MRRNCQRKLLTSCVPCDKVSQILPGTASVDFGVEEARRASERTHKRRAKSTTSEQRGEARGEVELCGGKTGGEALCAKSFKSFKSMY